MIHPARNEPAAPARRHIVAAALLAVVCAAAPAMAQQTIVRPIELPDGAEEHAAALVRFYAGDKLSGSARSLAVTDAEGEPVPYRLLAHRARGETVIAVRLADRPRPLQFRYGGDASRDAKRDETIPVSLLLRTYPLPSNPEARGPDAAAGRIQPARPLGAALVQKPGLGHNPFGTSQKFFAQVEGLIDPPGSQPRRLIVVADGMARMRIDGQTVSEDRQAGLGTRASEKLAERATEVTFDGSPRRFEAQFVQAGGRPVLQCGLVRDGRVVPIPGKWFKHQPTATLGPAKMPGGTPLGIDVRQRGILSYGDWNFVHFRFSAVAPPPEGASYRWRFPDAAAAGRQVEHVMVVPADRWGELPVRLELVNEAGQTLGRSELRVRPHVLDGYQSVGDGNALRQYVQTMRGVTYRRADRQRLLARYELAAVTEEPALIAPLAEAYLDQYGSAGGGQTLRRMKYTLATHLAGEQPERAAELFGELARGGGDPWFRARAAAEQLDLLIWRLGRHDEAQQRAKAMLSRLDERGKALMHCRRGDAERARGHFEQARKHYQTARRLTARDVEPRQAAVQRRAHRQTAISRLNEKRYPAARRTLFEWEARFPLAKLGAELPLVTARYLQAVGNHHRAVQKMRTLLKMEPMHPNRPEIVYRLGRSLKKLGHDAEANKRFDELAEEYPNSPFVEEAKRLR